MGVLQKEQAAEDEHVSAAITSSEMTSEESDCWPGRELEPERRRSAMRARRW